MKNSVIQGRNGGTLLSGGVPGNKGGGRLRNEVREQCAQLAWSDVVPYLHKCLSSGSQNEKKWACETLLRYGIGPRVDIDESESPNTVHIVFGKNEPPEFDEAAFEAMALSRGYTHVGEPITVAATADREE